MVKLYNGGVYLIRGEQLAETAEQAESFVGKKVCREEAKKGTIAYSILWKKAN